MGVCQIWRSSNAWSPKPFAGWFLNTVIQASGLTNQPAVKPSIFCTVVLPRQRPTILYRPVWVSRGHFVYLPRDIDTTNSFHTNPEIVSFLHRRNQFFEKKGSVAAKRSKCEWRPGKISFYADYFCLICLLVIKCSPYADISLFGLDLRSHKSAMRIRDESSCSDASFYPHYSKNMRRPMLST